MGRDRANVVRGGVIMLVLLATAAPGWATGPATGRDGRLEVLVVDPAGRPVGNADVDLRRWDGVPCGSASSNVAGVASIRLTPGGYRIFGVTCEGYSCEEPAQVVAAEPGTTKRLRMVLTPNLRGIVRDARGAPVAGAWVNLVGAGRAAVASDAHGQFEIAWDRRCQLREASAFTLIARHEERNLALLMEIRKDTSTLEPRLASYPPLTGRIVDPNGAGIGGAWVYATLEVNDWGQTPWGEEQTRADSTGRFEIRAVVPGRRYTLHAYADGYGSRDVVMDARTSADRAFDAGPVTLAPARLSVTGQVLDPAGYPVVNALIYGWGEGQPMQLVRQTDAEGRFVFAGVCAGRLDLCIDTEGGDGNGFGTRAVAHGGDADLLITSRYAARR